MTMTMTMLRARTPVAITVATLLLAACGSNDVPVDAAATTTATTAPNPNAEFTAAVSVGANVAPARVQFKIGERPAAGQSLPVTIRVTPTADIDKLQVFLEPEAGLTFVDEAKSTFVLDGMKPGAAHQHELAVLPAQDGVFLIKVNVVADAAGASKASEFAIPVIVGVAPPPPPPGG